MDIKEITVELEELHSNKTKLELKEAKLMDKFYELYPILSDYNKNVWVLYYGIEYLVTNIDFDEQKVYLESNPYGEDNEILDIGFLLFDEIFNESHVVIDI